MFCYKVLLLQRSFVAKVLLLQGSFVAIGSYGRLFLYGQTFFRFFLILQWILEHMELFFHTDQNTRFFTSKKTIFGTFHSLFYHGPKSVVHDKKSVHMTQTAFPRWIIGKISNETEAKT